MFSLQDQIGNYEMFLADSEEGAIVFWMSMFSKQADGLRPLDES